MLKAGERGPWTYSAAADLGNLRWTCRHSHHAPLSAYACGYEWLSLGGWDLADETVQAAVPEHGQNKRAHGDEAGLRRSRIGDR